MSPAKTNSVKRDRVIELSKNLNNGISKHYPVLHPLKKEGGTLLITFFSL
jgi:hypothetical protein